LCCPRKTQQRLKSRGESNGVVRRFSKPKRKNSSVCKSLPLGYVILGTPRFISRFQPSVNLDRKKSKSKRFFSRHISMAGMHISRYFDCIYVDSPSLQKFIGSLASNQHSPKESPNHQIVEDDQFLAWKR